MNARRLLQVPMVLLALAVAGAGLDYLAAPVWAEARARQPALRLDSVRTATGQGIALALLGGFRALVADASWLRLYTLWERRDLAGTDTYIRLVPAIDPRPVYFWLNGARMLAYDLPVWRIEDAGGFDAAAPAVQRRLEEEQARAAIAHLTAAMQFHPQNAELWVERANIELNKLRDLAAAAESYRRAWEQPAGPYYAARLHAEVLRRMGRKEAALTWLRDLHPKLPPQDESAAADLVLRRIRELEQELAVPALGAYRPRL